MRPARARRMGKSLALAILAFATVVASAQDTGQICLLAFVDQNEDGRRAGTEAPITRGIAASLLDQRGVTIRSQLLEDSPYAAEGLLCFENLLAGEYGIIVSSSEYRAMSPTVAEAIVRPGAPPARIDFGAKPLTQETLPSVLTGLAALDEEAVQSLLVVGGASAAVIILMSLLGTLVVANIIRRRREMASAPGGSGRSQVRAVDQPQSPLPTDAPGQGSPPVFSDQGEDW